MRTRSSGQERSHSRRYRYPRVLASSLAIASLLFQPSLAQTIEEITVTARKREETLQKTPISVVALTGSNLEKSSLSTLTDFGNFTPNVSLEWGTTDIGGRANASFFIRGIGQLDWVPTTDPGVGVYVDDVYLGRVQGAVLELADIQQVEILKGPQGTLFGKNTLGGAINVRTTSPKYEFSSTGAVTLGEDERFNLDAEMNIPIMDRMAARLSAAYRSQDGFVERPLADDVLGEENTKIIRGKLLYEPREDLTFLLSGDFTKIDVDANPALTPLPASGFIVELWNQLVGVPSGSPIGPQNSQTTNHRVSLSTGNSNTSYEGGGTSLKVEFDFDPSLLRSITAYREFDSHDQRDNDGSPADFGQVNYENAQHQFTQEFNLIGSIFAERLQYTLGFHFMDEHAEVDQVVSLAPGIFEALEALPSASIPLGPVSCPAPMAPCAGGAGNPLNAALDVPRMAHFEVHAESYAAFAEFDFSVTERVSAIAGVRYTEDRKDFSIASERIASEIPVVTPTNVSETWSNVTPRFGITFDATDDLYLYATAAKGYKAGGFNARPANAAVARITFDPEEIWAYEVGFKSTVLTDRIQLNGSGFYYDYTDVQLFANTTSGTQIVQVIDNAGEAEFKGGELELKALVTEALTISGSTAYLDADFLEAATTATGIPEDNELPKAPKWSGTLGAEYVHPFESGEVLLRMDYSYTDDNYAEFRNIEALKQDSRNLLNARVVWTTNDKNLEVALYGKNLLDEEYLLGGLDVTAQTGQVLAVPSEPREVGLQLKAYF